MFGLGFFVRQTEFACRSAEQETLASPSCRKRKTDHRSFQTFFSSTPPHPGFMCTNDNQMILSQLLNGSNDRFLRPRVQILKRLVKQVDIPLGIHRAEEQNTQRLSPGMTRQRIFFALESVQDVQCFPA